MSSSILVIVFSHVRNYMGKCILKIYAYVRNGYFLLGTSVKFLLLFFLANPVMFHMKAVAVQYTVRNYQDFFILLQQLFCPYFTKPHIRFLWSACYERSWGCSHIDCLGCAKLAPCPSATAPVRVWRWPTCLLYLAVRQQSPLFSSKWRWHFMASSKSLVGVRPQD